MKKPDSIANLIAIRKKFRHGAKVEKKLNDADFLFHV